MLLRFARAQAQEKPAVEHVNPAEAQKLIGEKEVRVLDVRTPEEFAAGHIARAQNIDFRAPDFEQKIAALDKTPRYIVHCYSGNRSGKALPLLQNSNASIKPIPRAREELFTVVSTVTEIFRAKPRSSIQRSANQLSSGHL